MKLKEIPYFCLIFILLACCFSQAVYCDIPYDSEYKFVERTEYWMQYAGGTNISYIWKLSTEYNILNYSSGILTYEQIDTQVNIHETNLSTILPFPYKARIGKTFINFEDFEYYYEVWEEEGTFGFVYTIQYSLGTISSEVRTAANFVFTNDVVSKFENVTIDVIYDESNDNLTYVKGDKDLTFSFYIEYDPNGVLLLHRVIIHSQCDTYQSGRIYTFERVDEFEFTEPLINNTNFSFSVLLLASLTFTLVFKKYKKTKRRINQMFRRELFSFLYFYI